MSSVGIRLFQRSGLVVFLALSVQFAAAQAPAKPGKPLPPGPMQAKVKAACTQCHNASRITEQRLSREQWSAELEKMEGLGASIAEEDRAGILSYLSTHFGAQKGAAKARSKKTAGGTN